MRFDNVLACKDCYLGIEIAMLVVMLGEGMGHALVLRTSSAVIVVGIREDLIDGGGSIIQGSFDQDGIHGCGTYEPLDG